MDAKLGGEDAEEGDGTDADDGGDAVDCDTEFGPDERCERGQRHEEVGVDQAGEDVEVSGFFAQ